MVPLGRPLSAREGGFSWRNPNISSGKEIPRVLRLLAYPLLFFIWSGLRRNPAGFFSGEQYLDLWAAVMLPVVYIVAWFVEQHLKHGRRLLPEVFVKPKFRITVVALFVVAAVVFPYLETEIDIFTFGLGGVLLVGALLISLKMAARKPGGRRCRVPGPYDPERAGVADSGSDPRLRRASLRQPPACTAACEEVLSVFGVALSRPRQLYCPGTWGRGHGCERAFPRLKRRGRAAPFAQFSLFSL